MIMSCSVNSLLDRTIPLVHQLCHGMASLNYDCGYIYIYISICLSLSLYIYIERESICLSVAIQCAGDLVSETLGSNPAFSRGRRVSFRFEYRLPVPEHRNKQKQIFIYIYDCIILFLCWAFN